MTLGRLGRVEPTLETGPSGLFLEPGILQGEERDWDFLTCAKKAMQGAAEALVSSSVLEPPLRPLHSKA